MPTYLFKTKRQNMSHRASQAGISLPLMAIFLAVMALVVLGVTRKQVLVAESNAGTAYGYGLGQVALGVDNYRATNLAALTAATPVLAGFANPMQPTVAELKVATYINAAVANTMPDGNGYRIEIKKQPAGCVGPSTLCNVYSVLSLTNPILDPNGIPSITRLGALVAAVPDPVGYSAIPDLTTIQGSAGAWSIPNPDPGQRAGIVAVVAGLGGSGSQWLRVGDPRDPSFTGNTTTAGYLKPSAGVGQTVIAGTVCTPDPTGAIRNDPIGRVLSCQGGKWTATDGAKSVTLRAPIGNVPGGTSFPVDVCPPGGIPWATYSAQNSAVNLTVIPPLMVLNYTVSQSGANWLTLTQAVSPPAAAQTVNGNPAILGVIPMGVFSSGCSF
jgi:hypothetical protein